MSMKLVPYLNFSGNTREAMEFYHTIFGGELKMQTFGEVMPTGDAKIDTGIMHSELHSNTVHFMASEGAPGTSVTVGNSMSMSLFGDQSDTESLKECFAKLSEGGTVTVPLDAAPWGGFFGMLTDKFGVAWLVNIGEE
jgi:PhnB protein